MAPVSLGYVENFLKLQQNFFQNKKLQQSKLLHAGESISPCVFTYSAYKLNVLFNLHSL